MAKKKPTARDECEATFEESLTELEAVVAELESGKLGLSDALARYEVGVARLKTCQQLLQRAERRIEMLSGFDADGNPITEPFDEQVASLEEKAAARGRRRTSDAKPAAGRAARRGTDLDDMDDPQRLF